MTLSQGVYILQNSIVGGGELLLGEKKKKKKAKPENEKGEKRLKNSEKFHFAPPVASTVVGEINDV